MKGVPFSGSSSHCWSFREFYSLLMTSGAREREGETESDREEDKKLLISYLLFILLHLTFSPSGLKDFFVRCSFARRGVSRTWPLSSQTSDRSMVLCHRATLCCAQHPARGSNDPARWTKMLFDFTGAFIFCQKIGACCQGVVGFV